MNSGPGQVSMRGLRLWPVAVVAGALVAALAVPSGALASVRHEHVTGAVHAWHPTARGTPNQVIDAATDPQAAGDALNSGCQDLSKCSWGDQSAITNGYGPPSVIGDALYNCSDDAYAETAIGISDEREESTSISETVSVEVGLGFLGFEKATAEFEAFSKQSESFSTEVESTSAVAVPPGWKGWNEYKVLTGFVSGNAYITEGINKLIEVKGIDLSFPGYQNPNDTTDTPLYFIGYRTPMTQDDITSRCGAINGSGLGSANPRPPPRTKHLATPSGSFRLTLCRRGGGCATRNATGSPPAGVRRATVRLARDGRTYATGTDTNGRVRLVERRTITRGTYRLTVNQEIGKPSRRTATGLTTIAAIKVR